MSIKTKNFHPRYFLSTLIITLGLFSCGSSLAQSPEKNQTWYKWNTADGQTQYTQTPPDAEIPFEEIESSQINAGNNGNLRDNPALGSVAAEHEPGINSQLARSEAAPADRTSNFSSIPQNARIIPNKYHYGSTEYKTSPVNAAMERARTD